MTNKEKVLKVWFQCPYCLRSCYNVCIDGAWRCELCFPPIASNREPVASPAEDARQSAAESLPAQTEQGHEFSKSGFVIEGIGTADCEQCGVKAKWFIACGTYLCTECCGLAEPAESVASLPPVEAKEKDEELGFICRWCNKPLFQNGYGIWFHRSTVATHCDRVAEPKQVADAKPSPDMDAALKALPYLVAALSDRKNARTWGHSNGDLWLGIPASIIREAVAAIKKAETR